MKGGESGYPSKVSIKDFFHFVFQMMDAIKGTMTEIYNDLSKNTTGSTIAEVSVR